MRKAGANYSEVTCLFSRRVCTQHMPAFMVRAYARVGSRRRAGMRRLVREVKAAGDAALKQGLALEAVRCVFVLACACDCFVVAFVIVVPWALSA